MLDPIIGEHPTLRHARKQIPALAASSETLVIVGEHGTGKTLLAKHIHAQSPFTKNKLIVIDCNLLDHRSQRLDLFGGAIGDSNTVYRSPLELETTVVIKFPDALFAELREKLADAIRTRVFTRFRSTKTHPVQCRVIFLLNNAPEQLHINSKHTQRLFQLLNHARVVNVPPLRRRKNDIVLLAHYFASRFPNRTIVGFNKSGRPHTSTVALLKSEKWFGNVAELKAFIASSVVPTSRELLMDVETRLVRQSKLMINERQPFSLRSTLDVMRSALIKASLQETNNNRVHAARLLGLTEYSLR